MRTPRSIVTLALPLLLAAGAAASGPPPATEADKAIAALLKEHENCGKRYNVAYTDFKDRFVAFAEEHRGTEAEVRAQLWLTQNTWWLRQEGTMNETAWPIAQDLLKRHPDSPQLGLLAEYQYVFSDEQREELYPQLIERSPHATVKAAGHFALARIGKKRGEDGQPNEHYQLLLDKYADVAWRTSTYGAITDAMLFPHDSADLAVGKTAPEIEGIDHHGKPMKLSDFRGTVIMLDFWGDW